MIIYECDYCEKRTTSKPPVKLLGATGTSGGILLPEEKHERNFCCTECFWMWAAKYAPC